MFSIQIRQRSGHLASIFRPQAIPEHTQCFDHGRSLDGVARHTEAVRPRRFLSESGPPAGPYEAPRGHSLDVVKWAEDEDAFVKASGFWSSHAVERSKGRPNLDVRAGLQDTFTGFPARSFPTKSDLTYSHPLHRHAAPTNLAAHPAWEPPAFHTRDPLRKLVSGWAKEIKDIYGNSDQPILKKHFLCEDARARLFDAPAMFVLQKTGYTQEDVITWAWILTASTSTELIHRYSRTVDKFRKQRKRRIPCFVPLQILRAATFAAAAFRQLVTIILDESSVVTNPASKAVSEAESDSISSSTQLSSDVTVIHDWHRANGMLLSVRLLRHARTSAPELFSKIVDISYNVMFTHRASQDDMLSNDCNRLLKLISLPATPHPMRNIPHQQVAQLKLVRLMIALRPELPLNREGFRSLISVQLAHKKLDIEADWARTKAESWPPWREDKLGMDASLTYPGRESRARKLLGRMSEAGYEHGPWEHAAKIFAGWDTDGSPTIQTRKHLLLSGPQLGVTPVEKDRQALEPLIWSSRTSATRSVREAWAAFLSYRKAATSAGQRLHGGPYEAMFEKLLGLPVSKRRNIHVVPGDGLETWPDPSNPNDVIYTATEPPTIEKLYSQMRKDNVRPSRRLLTRLVANSKDLSTMRRYIEDSGLPDDQKGFLLNYEATTQSADQEAFRVRISRQLMAAVVFKLAAVAPDPPTDLIIPASSTENDQSFRRHGLMMQLLQTKHRQVYNGLLAGLRQRVTTHLISQKDKEKAITVDGEKKHRSFYKHIWFELGEVLRMMRAEQISPDFQTFQLVNELCHLLLSRGLWPTWTRKRSRRLFNPLRWIKGIFARCVYGLHEDIDWIAPEHVESLAVQLMPQPYELRLLAETLGIFEDKQGLIQLLQWVSLNAADLQAAHQDIHQTDIEMWTVKVVARIFIENLAFHDESSPVTPHSYFDNAKDDDLPLQEDCERFMEEREGWVRRHRRYHQLRKTSNAGWRSNDETGRPAYELV